MASSMCLLGVLVLSFSVAAAIGYGVQGRQTVCGLPQDSGPCNGFFPRWYFNTTNNACQKFVYGGCDGNANNFPDFNSCFLNCGGDVRCWLPAVTGPCFAFFRRYYYNIFSQTCQEFVYGGCLGNANRFDDIDICEFQCGDSLLGNRGNRNRIQNRSGNQNMRSGQNKSRYRNANNGNVVNQGGHH